MNTKGAGPVTVYGPPGPVATPVNGATPDVGVTVMVPSVTPAQEVGVEEEV